MEGRYRFVLNRSCFTDDNDFLRWRTGLERVSGVNKICFRWGIRLRKLHGGSLEDYAPRMTRREEACGLRGSFAQRGGFGDNRIKEESDLWLKCCMGEMLHKTGVG
ncbi:hypothetical protein FCM35_KLT06592 [Carex littledalei]|uniref:Uncharacterized protein n=1 Tax=Carex littledalei TaxID=544730 RepID=A0A833V7X9_9POAL|nr:hypothetical protein FCM35_KLT06592 [Carex littledalei]